MKHVDVQIQSTVDRQEAERAARSNLPDSGRQVSLLAWYDRGSHTGGPMEPCGGELDKCAYDYARTHGADIRVSVNNGAYDFFYAPTPPETTELDRGAAIQLHEGLPLDDVENQQGG